MPRKTIAGLEAKIADLEAGCDTQSRLIDEQKAFIDELQARPAETYLTFRATGDVEVDALQVCVRAIDSLLGVEARARCGAYLEERFRLHPDEED